jgi:site-specific recombinase XerD
MGVTFSLTRAKAEFTTVRCSVSVDGTRTFLHTGVSIETKQWDFRRQFIIPQVGRLSISSKAKKLRELELSILELIDVYKYGKPKINFIEFEKRLHLLIDNPRARSNRPKQLGTDSSSDSLSGFIDLFIKHSEQGLRLSPARKKLKISTLYSFRTTKKIAEKYFKLNNLDLKLGDFNQSCLDGLSNYLIDEEGWSLNTHAKLMMDFLQIFKYAVKLKRLPVNFLADLAFDTRTEKTDSIYVTEDEILQLLEVKDFDDPEHELVRDVFVIGCFTGMRFSDYSVLDPAAIRDNRLSFIQAKTGAKVTIPIHSIVNTILSKYSYVLPTVPPNNKFNAIIKKVGEKLPCLHVPFTKQITYKREQTEIVRMKYDYLQTHTARRSFCSNEYLKGTDPMIIMAISGHKSHKSFMRYIKVSNEQFADKMATIWKEREKVQA